jgi:hypothetical protein
MDSNQKNKIITEGYKKGIPIDVIAQHAGIHRSNVLGRAKKLGLKHPNQNGIITNGALLQEKKMSKELTNDQVSQVIHAEQEVIVRKAKQTIAERKYKLLQQDYLKLQREFKALSEHMGRQTTPSVIKPLEKRSKNEAVPVLVLSDWHVEEEVKPHTVGGKNKYNLDIAKKRAHKVFQTAVKLIKEKEDDTNINTLAVFLLGDFITGRIHEENIENALLLPLDALQYAQELLEGGINYLLEHTDKKLEFFCKVGNHSRITHKVHASTEWENSLELAMYWSMMRKYKAEAPDRVTFHMEKSYLSVVDILGHKVRYHHGHAVNYGGGIGGLHIPLRKAIQNWNQTERAELDIMGHYHNFKEYSTLKYVVNGSLIGYSAYAERVKAVLEQPVQGFGIIHQKYGFTNLVPIYAE